MMANALTEKLFSPEYLKIGLLLVVWFVVRKLVQWFMRPRAPNPFAVDDSKPRKPYVIDQKKRDSILKQGFNIKSVPENIDAVVVGSGIGGLACAAILAKSGKKVLVLEQHDQAGGCCHTYIDKGYEFDVGIHYIGDCGYPTLTKVLLDQITDGQLEWEPLDETFDVVSIGFGRENRQYPVLPRTKWVKVLKERFPEEHKAIDKFFAVLKSEKGTALFRFLVKMLPLWLSKALIHTGVINLITTLWSGPLSMTTKDFVESLTSNKDLQTIFCYSWGDYGTPPADSSFAIQALLHNHYARGGWYPVGGASEIAHSVIPVIERGGGKVMVRVNVEEILTENGSVIGVKAKKGSETYEIKAPIVVSDAGLYNTFWELLPPQVAEKSYYYDLCKTFKPAVGCISVFIGFDASNKELKLPKQNMWAFTKPDLANSFYDYHGLSRDQSMDSDTPLMFISFPSTKDPNWNLHPGRANKATMAVITFANWDWYKEWQDQPLKKRADEYMEFKKVVGQRMIDKCTELFPQIKDHIDFVDVGSPLTHKSYIAQRHGEIYGLDHSKGRLDALNTALLRPTTDIPGLYLTGQDIFLCGLAGASLGGLLTASDILDRNLAKDLMKLQKTIIKSLKSKES